MGHHQDRRSNAAHPRQDGQEQTMSTFEEYGDGYPSEAELERIRSFEGTPREFVDFVGSIWRNGAGWSLEEEPHEYATDGRTEFVARFVTGGSSGCEEVQGVVSKTLFSLFYYAQWRRGGYHEYRVPANQIDRRGRLGAIAATVG